MKRDSKERSNSQAQAAARRFLDKIRNAPDRGTKGTIPWPRDQLVHATF